MGSSNKSRKHYKKDSRFVTDLYTFTYDNDLDFDGDKETTEEMNKPPKSTVAIEESKKTKENEREDLIARFDRVIRGESDGNLQVRNDLKMCREQQQYREL
ncbi:uncharacterized protein [Anoplolepis gracilipes]|uniref:uncharacterized protein n=1 Tax=Anoplolepis gracilipes TaxID=354296 RepID=UPI003BA1F5BE